MNDDMPSQQLTKGKRSPQNIVDGQQAIENNPLNGIDKEVVEEANKRRYLYAPEGSEPSQPEVFTEEPKPSDTGNNIVHYIMEGACCVPIIGNIIALKDVAFDTYEICKTDEHGQHANLTNVWLWVTLTIDGIGIIPAAGNASAPIRAVVRHGLWEFARGAGLAILTDQLLSVFHGDIEAFLNKLNGWIDDVTEKIKTLAKQLGASLAQFIHAPYDWAQQMNLIEDHWTIWPSDNAKKLVFKGIEALLDCMEPETRSQLEHGMTTYSVQSAEHIVVAIARILPLIKAIRDAIKHKRSKTDDVKHTAHISNEGKASDSEKHHQQKGDSTNEPESASDLSAKRHQDCPVCPNPLKEVEPEPETTNPINFVMGDENLWHTDFTVPGLIDLKWTRFYRSSCDMLDDSELGTRWSTPYHLRFEQGSEQLFFIDGDNRMVPLAPLSVGESRYEPVEHITLSHPSEHEIVLETLYNDRQRYVRMGSANTAGRQVFRLVEAREQDGNALHFEYDTAQRQMTRITDGAAMDVRLTYNAEGLVERIERHFPDEEHAPEVLSHYAYDAQRDLVAQTDARDRTRTYRYDQHLLTFYANRNGLGCHLEWEWPGQEDGEPANAREARCIHNWLDDGSEDTRFEYSRDKWYTKVTDAQGLVTYYRYNYDNRIESRTTPYQPHLGSEHWRWDKNGNLLAYIDGEGRAYDFKYDKKGRLISFSDPMSRTTVYEYDAKGRQAKATDPMGRARKTTYDGQGRVAADTDFAGRTTQFNYNDQSLPIKVIDPANNEYGYQWNEQGQLIASTDCSGQKTTYTYDHRGQLIEQTDALKQKIYFQRDRMGLPTVVRYPDGTTEQFEYDGEGNLTRYVNPTGEETRYAYDGKGLPVERIDAAGFRLAYQYDTLRRLSRLTNQNGEQWTFDYDGVGRLKQEVGFDGRTRKYQYDEGGMLLTYSEGDQATLYERDSTGLLKRKLIERTGHGIVETRYAHDMLGRLTSVQNSHSAVRLHYDALDNLIAEEQTADLPDGYHYRSVYRHTYDVLGNRQTTTLPNGQEVAWLRYGSGHVHAMSLDRQPLFDFERDALHRETARHYGVQQQTRQYDVMGRLTRQQRLLGEEAKQQRLYHYTQTSELYGIDDSLKGETRYQYDPIGRLKAASTPLGNETFAFDPAGNLIDPELLQNTEQHRDSQPINTRWDGAREEVKFDYRQLPKVMGNLLERYAGTHYQYDERGNRRRQTEPSGHTTEYFYDADDRLIEVKRYRRAPAAGDTSPPEMHAKYGYDGLGRRLWKLVKDGKAKPKLTVFSWDANLLTSEEVFEGKFHFWDTFAYPQEPELEPEDLSKKFSLPIAQRVHTLTARALKRTHWLYEPESFVPAAQLVETYDQRSQRMTGTYSVAYSSAVSTGAATFEPQLYYIHTDHLGTPQELTDRDGQLPWIGHYRAWGELAKATDSEGNTASVEMPLRFQGQYFDAETGLHYNRFRYYDPQVGRFTTQDPISLAGGLNLYQYAPNPVDWADPLGLTKNNENCPNWTPHGYKHVPPKNASWKDVVKSTKTGPAKYKPEVNIESLERGVHASGQPVTNGKPWKVQDMGEVIGASEGKPSQWVRVEESAGTIHGHPISKNEYLRLIK